MELATLKDLDYAVTNLNKVYGYIITGYGTYYLLKGVKDYKKIKKFIPMEKSGGNLYQMISKCGTYNKFFKAQEELTYWIDTYNKVAKLGKQHIYL